MRRRLRPRTRQSSSRTASPGASPAAALLSDAEDDDREEEPTQREKDTESEEEIEKEEEGEEEEISLWRCFVGELTLSERAAEERRMERLVDNMPGFVRVLVYVEKVRERETEEEDLSLSLSLFFSSLKHTHIAHSTHSLTLFEIKLFLWLERARRTRGITGASLLKGEKEKGSLLELLVGGGEKREGKDVIAFVCEGKERRGQSAARPTALSFHHKRK